MDSARVKTLTHEKNDARSVPELDAETATLVRLAAVVTAGNEAQLREAITTAEQSVRAQWVEELLLQSYLFSGFPRALNAMREWRRASGIAAPSDDEGTRDDLAGVWQSRGEQTCAVVYGDMYESLRRNIRALHPALDSWMIVEGYGKVLSRPALDLLRRELCIVAACAAAGQMRQLHSHLHGALHAGASVGQVDGTLDVIGDLVPVDMMSSVRQLWSKVSSDARSDR
jgi:4-carboxymuconolactone decarboxylase